MNDLIPSGGGKLLPAFTPWTFVQLARDTSTSMESSHAELVKGSRNLILDDPQVMTSVLVANYEFDGTARRISSGPGKFEIDLQTPYHPNTDFARLLNLLREDQELFLKNAREHKVRVADTLSIIITDAEGVLSEKELNSHREWAKKTTIVVAYLNRIEEKIAQQLATRDCVCPLWKLPLGEFFKIISRSITSSVSRPGCLQDIVTGSIKRALI